eukprot:3663751-Amphidinium_carterae.1
MVCAWALSATPWIHGDEDIECRLHGNQSALKLQLSGVVIALHLSLPKTGPSTTIPFKMHA